MSIQCDDCAIRVKYLLLVARNYILLLFICFVLRHITLLVACLVVARNWSLAWAWYIIVVAFLRRLRFISSDYKLWKNILDIHLTQHVELYICIIQHAEYLTLENSEGEIKNGKPEKMATYGTSDEDKQN